MSKKKTSKRKKSKKRTSSKRIKNIRGGELDGYTSLMVSDSSASINTEQAAEALGKLNENDNRGAARAALRSVKDVKIDRKDAVAASRFGVDTFKALNFANDPNNKGMNNLPMGQMGIGQRGERGIGPMGMSESMSSEPTNQTPPIQPGEYKVGIDQGNMDAGIGAIGDVLKSKQGQEIADNAASMSGDAASMTHDAAGTVHSATGAVNAGLDVFSGPAKLLAEAYTAAIGTAKGLNAAPGALYSAAKWAADDPLSIKYVESNGFGRRTRWAMEADLKRSLKTITAPMYIQKKIILKELYDIIKEYKIRIRCKKNGWDLFYSNNLMPDVVWVCTDKKILKIITDIETLYETIKRFLQTKIIELDTEFSKQITSKIATIRDLQGYKDFYEKTLNPQLSLIYKLSYEKTQEMEKKKDEVKKQMENLISADSSSDLFTNVQTVTSIGGKRKSKKTRTTKKRKTLRKKRT